jgi:hypothetical protein
MPWSSSLTPHAHAKQCTGGTTHPAAAHGSARHAHQLYTRVSISHCTRMSSPLTRAADPARVTKAPKAVTGTSLSDTQGGMPDSEMPSPGIGVPSVFAGVAAAALLGAALCVRAVCSQRFKAPAGRLDSGPQGTEIAIGAPASASAKMERAERSIEVVSLLGDPETAPGHALGSPVCQLVLRELCTVS